MPSQLMLAEEFDRSRGHLRAVAYRLLGSLEEAEDAVQEAWLKAGHREADTITNVTGWLTTIVGRVCLDMLRARRRRREDLADLTPAASGVVDPADEAVLADSVGLALLVVLDRLGPAERVAFVLHDLFAVPFDEIARILSRSPAAAKKLASRARHRVHGSSRIPPADLARQREVVAAFLAASRAGDLDALVNVLAPDVVRRADGTELRGAQRIAAQVRTNTALSTFARLALVNGSPGLIVAPQGQLRYVLQLTLDGDHVTEIVVISDRASLLDLDLAVLPGEPLSPEARLEA